MLWVLWNQTLISIWCEPLKIFPMVVIQCRAGLLWLRNQASILKFKSAHIGYPDQVFKIRDTPQNRRKVSTSGLGVFWLIDWLIDKYLIKDWRASSFQNRSSEVAQPLLGKKKKLNKLKLITFFPFLNPWLISNTIKEVFTEIQSEVAYAINKLKREGIA